MINMVLKASTGFLVIESKTYKNNLAIHYTQWCQYKPLSAVSARKKENLKPQGGNT